MYLVKETETEKQANIFYLRQKNKILNLITRQTGSLSLQ